MANNIPKFEGHILDIGNDYFLVRKDVVHDWNSQMKKLKKDVEELRVKPVEKKHGTVAGKEGRNEVLNSEQKAQAFELRKRGYSLRQIAEVFGVSHETIRQATLVQGLTMEQKRRIHLQKHEGWSVNQCYESLLDMGEEVAFTDVQIVYDEISPPVQSSISADPLASDFSGDVPTGSKTDIMGAQSALERIKNMTLPKSNLFGNDK